MIITQIKIVVILWWDGCLLIRKQNEGNFERLEMFCILTWVVLYEYINMQKFNELYTLKICAIQFVINLH